MGLFKCKTNSTGRSSSSGTQIISSENSKVSNDFQPVSAISATLDGVVDQSNDAAEAHAAESISTKSMSTESNAAQPTGAETSGVDIVTNNAASTTISIATNGSYTNFVELSKDKTSIYILFAISLSISICLVSICYRIQEQ
jgi:hypothetical protein